MQPGGNDVVIETERPIELMEIAVRWLFTHWKDAVVLDADSRKNWYAQDYYEIPFGEKPELFVFRDFAELASTESASERTDFIHLIRRNREFTVVMDPDSKEGYVLCDLLKSTKFQGAAP